MIVASLPKISRQQGLCVYESEHLVYVADTLEHLRILQLGLAWGVPVTLGGAVLIALSKGLSLALWRHRGGYSFRVRFPRIASPDPPTNVIWCKMP